MTDKNIYEKVSEVSRAVGFIEFDGENTFHKYKYASASQIIRALQTKCAEAGVLVYSESEKLYWPQPGLVQCTITLRWVNLSNPTDSFTSRGVGSGTDKGDKAVMKASTAAYKYAISHTLALAWGAEDPEKESPGYKKTPKPAKKRSHSASALKRLITGAGSVDALEELRKSVLEHKDTSSYGSLTKAFKARKEEI